MAAADDMAMQMRHGFSCVGAIVENEAETILFESKFFCYVSRLEKEMPEELLVFRSRFGDARDWLLWDDQNVHRRLRLDVAKGDHQVVFIDDSCRNLAGDDFFEQSLAHISSGIGPIQRFNVFNDLTSQNTIREQDFPACSLERQLRR